MRIAMTASITALKSPVAPRLLVVWLAASCLLNTVRGDTPEKLPELVEIPSGTFLKGWRETEKGREAVRLDMPGFNLGRYEVTAAEFAAYLNAKGVSGFTACPLIRQENGRYVVTPADARKPVSGVTLAEATAYTQWFSQQTGRRARLPSNDEWEYAARGGVEAARWPWGWGKPDGRARFKATGPCEVGQYAPNPFGLFDMAGNVYEWCAPDSETPAGKATARGGGWADPSEEPLRVYQHTVLPADTRGPDIGFRILVER
jgi:formylglycine-generating enzyme required for sulfatase activity